MNPKAHTLSLSSCALIMTIAALGAVQLSFILGGVAVLDAFVLLLIPAFLLYLWTILIPWKSKTKDYQAAFLLLTLFIMVSLFCKYRLEVGTIDDGYHTAKVIAHSIKNDFATRFQYIILEDERFFLIDFVESVWGLFWRFTRWDFIVVLLQSLPLVPLWALTHDFFKKNGVSRFPGMLALATLLSLQVFWVQQGTGYIDSTAGVFVAVVFFLVYDLTSGDAAAASTKKIAALALASVLCLISKTSLLLVGCLGLACAVWAGWKYIGRRALYAVLGASLLGLFYLFYHHALVWLIKGHPLYPWWGGEIAGKGFSGMLHFYYEAHPAYRLLYNRGINVQLLYVLVSWLLDYKYRLWISPDPWVGGNGVLWTWIVPLTVVMVVFRSLKNLRRLTIKITPRICILFVIVFYYQFFDGSIVPRFMAGFHVFILAWCLMWIFNLLERSPRRYFKRAVMPLAFLCLLLAGGSYVCAVDGDMFRRKEHSVFQEQYKIFPQYILPYKKGVPGTEKGQGEFSGADMSSE